MARQQAVSVTGKPLSNTGKLSTKFPRGCLVGFFSLFFLVGTILFFVLFLQPLSDYLSASQWIETPCEIIASKVVTSHSSDGTTYRPEVTFRYQFEQREYESDRLQFFVVSTNSESRATRIVEEYPVGRRTVCYVKPGDPVSSVLNRDMTLDFLIGLLPLTFVAVGLGGMFFSWRFGSASRGRSRSSSPFGQNNDPTWNRLGGTPDSSRDWDPTSDGSPETDDDPSETALPSRQPDGPRVLTPEVTPVGKFIGLLLVSLFWNGIVSVFVGIIISGFAQGKPEWFLTIFMVPFVIVGVGLILGTLHALLGLFNPRPTLSLLRGNLALGDRTQIRWQFAGSTRNFRKLVIFLQGTETAKYRRGTKTHTDTSVFYYRNVFETESPHEMEEGTVELEIPAQSMHTFLGTNNQVTWQLVVHGDVPFWPDVSDAFSISVYPLPLDDEEIVL